MLFLTFATMKRILCAILCGLSSMAGSAQYTQILSDDIHSLRIAVDGREERVPILTLNGGEQLQVSFDDLTHDYRRYTYQLEHCTYDFQTTENLFESEYLTSPTNEEIIQQYEQSLNTAVLYTHYSFSFPNATLRPRLSGNYRLTIFRDENGEKTPVVKTYFSIMEPLVNVAATASSNTDIDWQKAHQQVSMQIDTKGLPLTDAREELRTYVLQNRRWDNAVVNPPYTSQMGKVLAWEHCRELIFPAGNEYRKFETLSTRYATMRVDRLFQTDGIYHAAILADEVRPNYLYDEDQNGLSVIRTNDYSYPATEAEYIMTHFTLLTDELPGKRIFLDGRWTDGRFSPKYELHYNAEVKAYEADILLKQGYYSYQYLTTSQNKSTSGKTKDIEGDYFQTENEYTVLVYYSKNGDRYDRLVGALQFHSNRQ